MKSGLNYNERRSNCINFNLNDIASLLNFKNF